MELLKLEHLSKYYTAASSVVLGLSDINLSFELGEFVAVTGESGSGKSTLAQVIGGILPYENGEMYVEGRPTSHYDRSDWEEHRRDRIGFISQSYGILVGNTVLENVEIALRLSGVESGEARERARELLKRVRLSELEGRKAGKLSSGQKQRLSIARALAKSSKILVADEPTGNLDPENSKIIIELLAEAAKDRLVILITHDFEEARELVSRRVTLADGVVVSDVRMGEREKCESKTVKSGAPVRKKGLGVVPYITAMTMKSRPVFTAIIALFLAVTAFMSFVFLGSFTVALDDTSTKIYDDRGFMNGSPDRLVVMKDDLTSLTEEDIARLLSVKYVNHVERYGYISDVTYSYRKGVDYLSYLDVTDSSISMVNGQVVTRTDDILFIETGIFLSSFPRTKSNILSSGRLPESFYEVLSADPDYKVGDTVTVYIRNREAWSPSAYMKLTFDVVGTTSYGSGLYFSDSLAAAFNCSRLARDRVYIPFEDGRFGYSVGGDPELFSLDTGEVIISEYTTGFDITQSKGYPRYDGEYLVYRTVGRHNLNCIYMIVTSEEDFVSMTSSEMSNQVSLFIKDYAYTDRVIDKVNDLGYTVLSPFRVGADSVDTDLEIERYITLAVCLVLFVIVAFLQIILLRATFSSQHEHYRLLSNMGLTLRAAKLCTALQMLVMLIVGEAVCVLATFIMNSADISYIVNIYKHLETPDILILFAAHVLSAAVALSGVLRSLSKRAFAFSRRRDDINITEDESND